MDSFEDNFLAETLYNTSVPLRDSDKLPSSCNEHYLSLAFWAEFVCFLLALCPLAFGIAGILSYSRRLVPGLSSLLFDAALTFVTSSLHDRYLHAALSLINTIICFDAIVRWLSLGGLAGPPGQRTTTIAVTTDEHVGR